MLFHNSLTWLSVHQVTKVPEKLLSFAVRCKNLTVSNTRTVLLTPEIYISQNVYEQLLDLLLDGFSGARRFSIRPVQAWLFPFFCIYFFLPLAFLSLVVFGKAFFFSASYKVTVFQSQRRLLSLWRRSLLAYSRTRRCVPLRRWWYQCSISSRDASKTWTCASLSSTHT